MKFLGLIGALAIIIAVAAVVFFFGGFYNVAATSEADYRVWTTEASPLPSKTSAPE